MKFQDYLLVIIVVAGPFFSGCSKQESNPPQVKDLGKPTGDRFIQLDQNNNSYISRNEWEGTDEAFKGYDRDGDGALSRKEFEDRSPPRITESPKPKAPADRFSELDGNQDKLVSRNEWLGTSSAFTQRDHDGDGFLTRKEFSSPSEATTGSSGKTPARPEAAEKSRDSFTILDRNSDGVLSRAEWEGSTEAFNQRDKNNDGVMSAEEYKAVITTESPASPNVIEDIFNEIKKRQ